MLVFARIFVGIRAKDRRPHGSIKGEELQEICTQRLSILGKGRPRMAPSMMWNRPNIQTKVAGVVVP